MAVGQYLTSHECLVREMTFCPPKRFIFDSNDVAAFSSSAVSAGHIGCTVYVHQAITCGTQPYGATTTAPCRRARSSLNSHLLSILPSRTVRCRRHVNCRWCVGVSSSTGIRCILWLDISIACASAQRVVSYDDAIARCLS